MSIKFKCPYCFRPYSVKDELGGQRKNCKKCGREIEIPGGPSPRKARDLVVNDAVRERLVHLRLLWDQANDPVLHVDQVADMEDHLHCVLPDAILAAFASDVNALDEDSISHICDYQDGAADWGCPDDLFAVGEGGDGHVLYCIPRYSSRTATVGITTFCNEDMSTTYESPPDWLDNKIEFRQEMLDEDGIDSSLEKPSQFELGAFMPRLVE